MIIYFLWVSIVTNFGVINPTVISNIISFIKDDFNYKKDKEEDPCNANISFIEYFLNIFNKVLNILIYVPLIIFNIIRGMFEAIYNILKNCDL